MNETNRTTTLTYTWAVASTVFSFGAAVVISTGSFIVLFVMVKDPQRNLRTPTGVLIMNLTVSDLLAGFIVGNLLGVDGFLDTRRENSFPLDAAIYILTGLLMFASIATIIAMSFDRLISVSKPLLYRSIVTSYRMRIVIAMIWFLSIILGLLPVFLSKFAFLLVYSHTHVTLPIVLLTGIFVYILKTLKKQTAEIISMMQASEGRSTEEKRENSLVRKRLEFDRRLTYITVAVLVLFLIAALPFYVSVQLYIHNEFCGYCMMKFETLSLVWQVAVRFGMVKPAMNPIILLTRMPKIRAAAKHYFGFLKCKPRHVVPGSTRKTYKLGDRRVKYSENTKKTSSLTTTGIANLTVESHTNVSE